MRTAIAIIPNEEILNVPPFYRDLRSDVEDYHGFKIQDFSDKYGLGITPESLGFYRGEAPGNRYQMAITSMGHTVVCLGERVWIYLPEYMSKGQKKWFLEQKNLFKKYKNVLYYAVVSNDKNIIAAGDYADKNNMETMYDYIENSILYGVNLESEEVKR